MRFLCGLVLVAFATLASAETALVKAGDHAGFSRIVVYSQTEETWQLRKVEGGYLLRTPGQDFDLSDVFSRMDNKRVTGLEKIDAGLLVRTECDCHVNTFFLAPDMVVIDVNDGPGTDLGVRTFDLTPEQEAGLEEALSSPDRMIEVLDLKAISREKELADVISAAESLLIEQLGRAASQGLAIPKVQVENPADREITPMAPRTPQTSSEVLSATSAIDIIGTPNGAEAGVEQDCPPAGWFPTKDWSVGASFSEGLGQLRSELYDELDETSPERFLKLSRHYVAHGFTLEALDLIAENRSEEADFLRSLIGLIEGKKVVLLKSFGKASCQGSLAVWRYLSMPPQESSESASKELLRSMQELPPDLARIILPMIIEKATQSGDDDLVLRVGRQMRFLVDPDAEIEALPHQDGKSGAKELLQLARKAEDGSPKALLKYVYQHFADRTPVAADIPDLVAAYAFESQGTPIGAGFDRATLMVAGLSNEFASIWQRLDERSDDVELISGLYHLLLLNASDAQFLRLTSSTRADLDPELRRGIAARHVRLGFHDIALDWIPADSSPETRSLRAEIYFRTGRYAEALAEIEGATGDEAALLRAKISMAMEAYSAAARNFVRAETELKAVQAALLSRDRGLISEVWNDDLSEVLAVSISVQPAGQVTLSEARRAIEIARSKASALTEALGVFPDP